MTLSIGVAYTPGQWNVCVADQGQPAELHTFTTASALLELVTQICMHYPEPTLVLSLPVNSPFCTLRALSAGQEDRLARSLPVEAGDVLQALRSLSEQSYCAPSVAYLPNVPLARRLIRPDSGSANEVCAVVALLQHMRSQEAPWSEMNFLCVRASQDGSSILVVQDGQIINGIGTVQGSAQTAIQGYLTALEPGLIAARQTVDEAFWEGLTQDLAGLLALHHIEDLVAFGPASNSVVERLAETAYQVYLFPYARTEREGYEAASGAALLAEGLHPESSAAEVVEHLKIRQSDRIILATELF